MKNVKILAKLLKYSKIEVWLLKKDANILTSIPQNDMQKIERVF